MMRNIGIFTAIALFCLAVAAGAGYIPKVYHKQGGTELVVASGGKITIESGGSLVATAGTIDSIGVKRLWATLNGSAKDASIGRSTDKDTGLYWLTATGNRMGITAKGTAVAIFDSAGAAITGIASADTVRAKSAAFTSYLIADGTAIFRSGATVTGAISATTTVTGAGILNTGKYYGLTAASAWSDTTGWTGPKLFIFAAADTLYIYKADHTVSKFAAL